MKLLSTHPTKMKPEKFLPIAEEEFKKSVVEYFEKIVDVFPEKIAIIDKYSEITYRDYNNESNKCARAILDLIGDKREKTILFLADHSIYSMIAILGILKSGNIYVALDSSSPIDRLNAIIKDSQSNLILTNDHHLNLAKDLSKEDFQVLNIDKIDPSISNKNLNMRATSQNLAVIFYTSGSTGIPKGVLLDHRSLMERVAGKVNSEFIFSGDRILLPFPAGFGWSTQPMFMSLLTGATLYVQSYLDLTLTDLQELLKTNQITYFPATSSYFRQFLASLPENEKGLFPHLRNINIGGEPLHKEDILKWQEYFSEGCQLVYPYSSTECLICKSFYNIDSEINNENLLLEYLADSMKLYILDNDNKPIGNDKVGQIAYRSPAMLRGYWNRPEMNSQLFIPDPEDPNQTIFLSGDLGKMSPNGFLELKGRIDMMVKIRGYRIDTSEVESIFYKYAAIKNAFITGWSDPTRGNEPELIAYISLKNESVFSIPDLRTFLGTHLPTYMVPTRFIILDDLPLNPNGKVDRDALPNPGSNRPDINTTFAAPSNELEYEICEIWQDVLNIDQVGVNDDFFELGGNSLTALQMIIRTEKLVGQKTSPLFFQHPTITNLIADLNNQASHVPNQSGEALSQKRNRPFNSNRKRKKKSGRFRQSLRKLESALVVLPYLPILRQSYSAGIQWLLTFSRKSWVKRGLYFYQYSLMRNFIADLDTKQLTVDQIMPASIVGNILINLFARTVDDDESVQASKRMQNSPYPFWNDLIRILLEAPLEILNKYFSVTGLEYLKQAIEANNGVILVNYHSTAGRFASRALLRQLDDVEIVTINQRVARQQSKKWMNYESRKNTDAFDSALFANEALKGQHLLMEGKIIQLVGDIEYENSTDSLKLGGRKYSLKTGFAELALNTGAPVIPLFSTIKADGHVLTTFKPPLDPGSGDRASQIQNLMNGYAAYMDSAWSEAPESVKWTRLRSHLKKPLFD